MKYSIQASILSILFASLFLLASCSNPAGGEEEHHEHAEGAVFFMNGDEIARYENGDVTGTLSVPEGGEAEISIEFIGEDGDLFQPEDPDYSLQWTVADETVATISDEPAAQRWIFTLSGEAAGNTTAEFSLYHDSHDHAELTTTGIPVEVVGGG